MDDLAEIVKRATKLPDAIAADLAVAGGILRCGTCGAEQPVGDIASHLSRGWPQHCDQTMTWVTRKMLLAETREVPDGYELVAVESADWRLETGRTCSRRGCGNPCAAALNRRRTYWRQGRTVDAWYRYCVDDLYGNWIEDGRVWHWILREQAAIEAGGTDA